MLLEKSSSVRHPHLFYSGPLLIRLVVFETNTASCGGFPGASDSFGAGLYLLDLSLQAAFRGISQVLFHNGGVGQYYNLFTPPQTNQSNFREWTTGSPYYSALIMAEAMSKPGSQVVDLQMNGGNVYTPGMYLSVHIA